jgi:uncharacterized membrane protein
VSVDHLPSELTSTVAAVPFAIAAVIIITGSMLALLSGRHAASAFASHLTLGLEFLLAAGLIRLASANSLEMLGLVGAIIVTRRIIILGIRWGTRAVEG